TVVGVLGLFLFVLQPTGLLHLASPPYAAVVARQPAYANLGHQVVLIGFDAPEAPAAAGETLDVRLYWQAIQPLDINYQSFVHLLAADGTLVAQSDHLNPGEFPTRRWPVDKYVRDSHVLQLPAELAPGTYTLAAGLWVAAEGWRLPLLDADGAQVGDTAILTTIEVEGR
ncbi:MAG: hypothetical protein KC425_24835, partial [Anaerolineales bacterium]|nr:hypothetical protein [Anaerolineales bacterium]